MTKGSAYTPESIFEGCTLFILTRWLVVSCGALAALNPDSVGINTSGSAWPQPCNSQLKLIDCITFVIIRQEWSWVGVVRGKQYIEFTVVLH